MDLALEILPQVLVDGLVLGFMYALIALGYTMVYGVLEFINFAHSEIFVLGAFVGVEILLMLQSAGLLATLHPAAVLLLIILAAMVISGLAAMALERIAYRPLQGSPRLVALISAIGASFFLQDGLRLVESLWRNTFYLNYPPPRSSRPDRAAGGERRRAGEIDPGRGDRARHALGSQPLRQPHPHRRRDPRRGPRPRHRVADGRAGEPGDRDDLFRRRRDGRFGRRAFRSSL